jgi:H+/Cl- antiporter ClcA
MKTSLDAHVDVSPPTRGGVVNRTHRVVRQRAQVMQARRDRVRSLMVPLFICSALLILSIIAVWSGLYQYQATEAAQAVQADVAALAANDATNHFLVVLLWFVPVSLALLAAVWLRRVRGTTESETVR